MSDESEPRRDPPTPERPGIDPGTWIWIVVALLATLAIMLWAAYAGAPSAGPS